MSTITKNHVVIVSFTVTDTANDEVLEEIRSFAYLHGHDNLPEKLEGVFDGRSDKEAFDEVVEEAFGPLTGESRSVRKSDLPRNMRDKLEVGRSFWSPVTNEQLWITGNRGSRVTGTPDHPYGGKTVRIAGQIHDVRSASPEEIAHGHAHGPGGHHH